MRVGFSIILNGLHHLQHNDYAEYLANNLDLWIIAEGASLNQGSTQWCKEMPDKYHKFGISNDGTWEYVVKLSDSYPNVKIVNHFIKHLEYKDDDYCRFWKSKDHQVNACIAYLKYMNFSWKVDPIYLWQIDIDEQWKMEDMAQAEKKLGSSGCRTGMFHCDYWVGPNLQARGEWGEGLKLPYRRLWIWEGEDFKTHEPPVLGDGSLTEFLLSQRFQHYAYYFEKDVQFKNDWYSGHEGILERWKKLNNIQNLHKIGTSFPIGDLLPKNSYWGKSNTVIRKVGV